VRGLTRAAKAAGFRSVPEYVAWLRAQPAESPTWHRAAGALTVGESYFFRDGAAQEALSRHVLPALIAERRHRGSLHLRLWSAGCSTGEEPYTLAMLVDRLLPDRADWHVTILGTDIDTTALEQARGGIYREWSLREAPAWCRAYFTRRGNDRFELSPEIRAMVAFAPQNLAAAGQVVPGAMDVILCRNVLMYFTAAAQQATVGRLVKALVDGGWLVVSAAEGSAELLRPLAPVYFPGAVLRRKEPRRAAAPPSKDAPRPAEAPDPLPVLVDESEPPLLARAREEADRGQLDSARELCRAALAHDRLDAEAHLLLAAVELERGHAAAALESARAAVYAAPDSAPAHFVLGSLLLGRGAIEPGRRSMETVASLLDRIPPDRPVWDGEGMTAGDLLAAARAHLALVA